MNEGHVAFLGLERARERVREGDGLADALKAVARNTVFTTHTPVPAGNETFDRELVRRYLEPWTQEVGCDPDEALALGADDGNFNLTVLAIRLSSRANGVSQLHAQVSSAMWRHLLAGRTGEAGGRDHERRPHRELGRARDAGALRRSTSTPTGSSHLLEADFWTRIRDIPDAGLWAAHRSQKERLIRFVRERVRLQSARHGLSPDELRRVEGLLDPRALTIGFARRFATYKRAVLVLSDLDRLRALVADAARPVQIIFAGKAHPADREGQDLIRRLFVLTQGEFQGKLVFLEDYDIEMGRMMVQGCDVWLNTPRRPQEASGTSGQKGPINGGINLSILDGWWAEGYRGDNGWAIGDVKVDADTAVQDPRTRSPSTASSTRTSCPASSRATNGLPRQWIQTMKASIESVVAPFSANRMVRDYLRDCYQPAAGGK